jgi:hypothetical protein
VLLGRRFLEDVALIHPGETFLTAPSGCSDPKKKVESEPETRKGRENVNQPT